MYEICSGWTIKTPEQVKHDVKPSMGKTVGTFFLFSINGWWNRLTLKFFSKWVLGKEESPEKDFPLLRQKRYNLKH